MRTLSVALLRLWFRYLGPFTPCITVRLAAFLFTKPLGKRALSALEAEILNSATRFSIPYNDSMALTAYRWGNPSAPIVLCVHGWTGSASNFLTYIDPLCRKGFQVVAFDCLAHGSSPGITANLIQWTECVVAAVTRLNKVHCIIGHSIGAGAIVIASNRSLNTEKLVLISPMSDIVRVNDVFSKELHIPKPLRNAVMDYFANKYQQRIAKYGKDWQDIFHSNFKVPTLILHDRRDKEIPWSNGKAIADLWPWAEFVTTEGLGHRRILIDANVVNQIAEFV